MNRHEKYNCGVQDGSKNAQDFVCKCGRTVRVKNAERHMKFYCNYYKMEDKAHELIMVCEHFFNTHPPFSSTIDAPIGEVNTSTGHNGLKKPQAFTINKKERASASNTPGKTTSASTSKVTPSKSEDPDTSGMKFPDFTSQPFLDAYKRIF